MNKRTDADQSLRVFICHASEDKYFVRILFNLLTTEGIDVWLDDESLVPGQDWDLEIRKALRRSHVAIVCLSQRSVSKTGFLQREIKYVLDVADEQPEGTIFLIPIKLEPCDIPERLKHLQWVSLYDTKGYRRLVEALTRRATELGVKIAPTRFRRQHMTLFDPDSIAEPFDASTSSRVYGELVALNNQGKYTDSATRLEQHLIDNPKDWYVLYHYLQDLREYFDQEELAISILDRILPEVQSDSDEWAGRLFKNRALAILFGRYRDRGKREDLLLAKTDLISSVNRNPLIAESWLNLGIIYTLEGDFVNADQSFTNSLLTSGDGKMTGGINDMREALRNDPGGFLAQMREFYKKQRD